MKMFKAIGVAAVIASASLAGAADYSHLMHVNVPFAFVVAGRQFSPGQYVVKENDNGVITLQGEGKSTMVISTPINAKASETSKLQFTNAAPRDLLSVAVEGERNRAIPVHSVQERKLIFK